MRYREALWRFSKRSFSIVSTLSLIVLVGCSTERGPAPQPAPAPLATEPLATAPAEPAALAPATSPAPRPARPAEAEAEVLHDRPCATGSRRPYRTHAARETVEPDHWAPATGHETACVDRFRIGKLGLHVLDLQLAQGDLIDMVARRVAALHDTDARQ